MATQAEFDRCVQRSRMEVLQDAGLHRHLRFKIEGGGFTWFEIITWPGKLVITGDCETFTFARLTDMFEFFRASGSGINPSYWQEKICDGRERARRFDWNRFCAEILNFVGEDMEGEPDEARAGAKAALQEWLDTEEPDEWGAVNVVRNFEFDFDPRYVCSRKYRFTPSDGGVPDGRNWDFHYLWCCRAIVWAIAQYDALHAGSAVDNEQGGAQC